MSVVTFEIPQHSLEALNVPNEEVAATLRMAAAVKLYEMERLSSGAAAELAGVPKPVFLARLADFGVDTFRLSEEELLGEAPLA
jgi:predicted HTH domain antitoxin